MWDAPHTVYMTRSGSLFSRLMDTRESINMDLPLPVPETNMEKSDLLVTSSENSNSLIEALISDLKESITRNQERLTDLEELIKQMKPRSFTTEENEKLVKLLQQVKADGDLRERIEELESLFFKEKSDKVSETKTELETDHTSASCATAIAESEPAHTEPAISDALHALVAKLEVIASEITQSRLSVRPRFRPRGQNFARYRVRTKSRLSSASSGVGFSHEFEDLDYPLSRTGSFAQPTMSPVPPAVGDLIGDLNVITSEIVHAAHSETLYVRPHFRSRGQTFARYHVSTKSQLSSASSGVGFSHEFEDLDYPLSKPAGSLAQQPMSPVPPDGDQTSIERHTELQPNLDPKSFRTISQVNFDARGLKYHMSDHGITVIIPENTVTTEALLSIGVYYINSFQIPEDHRLVSEVFWIKTSVPLQQNIELYVPHFVKIRDENDSNKLGFFMASDVSTKGTQTLMEAVPANTNSFEPGSCYGKLVVDHFCSGCILERIDENGLSLHMHFFITVVFPNGYKEKEKWKADIVFSYALKSCLKVIEKQYPEDEYLLAKSTVTFTQPSAILDYELEPVRGWSISHIIFKEMSKDQIDYHNLITPTSGDIAAQARSLQNLEELNVYPPRLSLQVSRTGDIQEHLKTNVIVKCVNPQVKFQIFARCPGKAEPLTMEEPSEAQVQQSVLHQHSSLAENKQDQLFLKDAILILQDHFVKDWYTLGLHLGLDVKDLNVIESNSISYVDKRASVRQMLTKWKDKFDREATWQKIVIALRKTENKRLAREIEEQFIQLEKQPKK